MSGTKHPIYGDDGLAGLGQSRPTPTHRDATMITANRTPLETAQFLMRLTGGQAKPEVTAETYRINAANMRKTAAKAAASKTGKVRGITAADALAQAEKMDRLSVEVPNELRKLLAA